MTIRADEKLMWVGDKSWLGFMRFVAGGWLVLFYPQVHTLVSMEILIGNHSDLHRETIMITETNYNHLNFFFLMTKSNKHHMQHRHVVNWSSLIILISLIVRFNSTGNHSTKWVVIWNKWESYYHKNHTRTAFLSPSFAIMKTLLDVSQRKNLIF